VKVILKLIEMSFFLIVWALNEAKKVEILYTRITLFIYFYLITKTNYKDPNKHMKFIFLSICYPAISNNPKLVYNKYTAGDY